MNLKHILNNIIRHNKKFILGITALSVLVGGCVSRQEKEIYLFNVFNSENGKVPWKEVVPKIKYEEDKNGEFLSAYEALKQGKGDCEEFAICSCAYSGDIYGNNLLVSRFYNLVDKSFISHAAHLLEKDGKYGIRGQSKETIEAEYNFEDLIKKIQYKRLMSGQIILSYSIVNLDEVHKDWKTTSENMFKYFRKAYSEAKEHNIETLPEVCLKDEKNKEADKDGTGNKKREN
jgi:hypothetical protein